MDANAWWWTLQGTALLVQIIGVVYLIKYTRETVLLRKNADSQNAQIALQLEIAKKSLDRQIEQDRASARPQIKFDGGADTPPKREVYFKNLGGHVIVIEAKSSPTCGFYFPLGHLWNEPERRLKFSLEFLVQTEEAFIGIKFQTPSGEEEVMCWSVTPHVNAPVRCTGEKYKDLERTVKTLERFF